MLFFIRVYNEVIKKNARMFDFIPENAKSAIAIKKNVNSQRHRECKGASYMKMLEKNDEDASWSLKNERGITQCKNAKLF